MKGKLYGIGTGPGDPELLTIKAVNTIKSCAVIAVPAPENSERTAYNIVEQYLTGKTLLDCGFSMDRDENRREAARAAVAGSIAERLDRGLDVGFITLGDPTLYSTYMYIHRIITEQGYRAEIIPGVTSFSAAAASFNTSLCEGGKALHIIPASRNKDIDALLDLTGNKVIMKSGKSLRLVLDKLKQRGLDRNTMIAERCTMEGQRLFNSISDYEAAKDAGYFTVAIVKEDE